MLAAVLSFGAWALSSPVGSSPDDDFHLASIWCGLGERTGLCEPGANPGEMSVPLALNKSACFASDPKVSGACQFEANLLHSDQMISTNRGSFASNYPPVYYATMSVFASQNYEFSVVLMRFVNIFIFLGTVAALWLLLPVSIRRVQLWLWAITSIPLGIFIIASNNPSAWAIIGVGGSWLALYGFFLQKGKIKWFLAVLYLVEVLIASGARADAAVYSALGGMIVCFLHFSKEKQFVKQLILPAVGLIIALYFFFTSQQATVAADGLALAELGTDSRSPLGVLAINVVQIPELWVGVFGFRELGWLDTRMPAIVWVTSFAAFISLMAIVMKNASTKAKIVLLGLFSILYFLPLYILQKGLNHVGEQLQPRYLLPLFILFAVVALVPLSQNEVKVGSLSTFILLSMLTVANSVALYVNTKRYVSGIDKTGGFSLDEGIEWWWNIPASPMNLWAVGSVAFGLTLFFAFRLSSLSTKRYR